MRRGVGVGVLVLVYYIGTLHLNHTAPNVCDSHRHQHSKDVASLP